MRKTRLLIIWLLPPVLVSASAASYFHQQQYEITVTNIKVPLRVFDDTAFVRNLSMADFEVFEDGRLQDIKALYMIRNGQIEAMDADRDYMPLTSRRFYFVFQIMDYNPKITESIEYFFDHVFEPGDSIVVQTPVKNYLLSAERAGKIPKETLVRDLQSVVRKDAKTGAMEYNTLLKDLKRLVRSIATTQGDQPGGMMDLESSSSVGIQSLQFLLPRYRDAIQKMEQLRLIDEKWILRFASQLKQLDEEKIVYFYYQREFRPEIQNAVLNNIISQYHDDANITGQVQDLFQVYSREITLDGVRLGRAFADASILFNFFFINKTPETVFGVTMREQSEDVFKIFTEVAEATGGLVDNSQNPAAAMKSTAAATECCYLLYYSPENYNPDGNYRTITVKVKDRDYRIIHRQGYYAR